MVSMWDAQNKKRICQVPGYETSISAMAFSRYCSDDMGYLRVRERVSE